MSSVAPPPHAAPRGCCSPVFLRQCLVVGYLIYATYIVFVGTFLAVFVPQRCDNPILLSNSTTVVSEECTFAQNVYQGLDPYNVFAILLNLATFLVLMVGFIVEFRREKWIIYHLDVDPKKAEDNLVKELSGDAHPELGDELKRELFTLLRKYNRQYKQLFQVIFFLMIANAAVSGVLVFYYWFMDVRCQRARRFPPNAALAAPTRPHPAPHLHPRARSTAPPQRTSPACFSWAAASPTPSPCPRTARKTTWRSR